MKCKQWGQTSAAVFLHMFLFIWGVLKYVVIYAWKSRNISGFDQLAYLNNNGST